MRLHNCVRCSHLSNFLEILVPLNLAHKCQDVFEMPKLFLLVLFLNRFLSTQSQYLKYVSFRYLGDTQTVFGYVIKPFPVEQVVLNVFPLNSDCNGDQICDLSDSLSRPPGLWSCLDYSMFWHSYCSVSLYCRGRTVLYLCVE